MSAYRRPGSRRSSRRSSRTDTPIAIAAATGPSRQCTGAAALVGPSATSAAHKSGGVDEADDEYSEDDWEREAEDAGAHACANEHSARQQYSSNSSQRRRRSGASRSNSFIKDRQQQGAEANASAAAARGLRAADTAAARAASAAEAAATVAAQEDPGHVHAVRSRSRSRSHGRAAAAMAAAGLTPAEEAAVAQHFIPIVLGHSQGDEVQATDVDGADAGGVVDEEDAAGAGSGYFSDEGYSHRHQQQKLLLQQQHRRQHSFSSGGGTNSSGAGALSSMGGFGTDASSFVDEGDGNGAGSDGWQGGARGVVGAASSRGPRRAGSSGRRDLRKSIAAVKLEQDLEIRHCQETQQRCGGNSSAVVTLVVVGGGYSRTEAGQKCCTWMNACGSGTNTPVRVCVCVCMCLCRFVANPVPKSTRELRYHQLMAEQHAKRAATHNK